MTNPYLIISAVWCAIFALQLRGTFDFLKRDIQTNVKVSYFAKQYVALYLVVSFIGVPYYLLRFTIPSLLWKLYSHYCYWLVKRSMRKLLKDRGIDLDEELRKIVKQKKQGR